MIRIVKPRTAPAVLRTVGRAAAREHCNAHARGDPINIQNKIYRHPSVKAALRTAQHDKCAFCESKFSHVGHGDVEHFRPKAGYKQKASDVLQQPGYYWLAYSWDNLFLSCQLCNQQFKRNLFPLEDPTGRATSHRHRRRVTSERPLLLDPGKEDPNCWLTFSAAAASAIDDNSRGKTTIDVFGLNRPELKEARKERLELALHLAELRRILLGLAARRSRPDVAVQLDKLNARLQALQAGDAEYAAMMRAALAAAEPPSTRA